jgi:hypothetical protein
MARKKAQKVVVSKPAFEIPEIKLTRLTRKFIDRMREFGMDIDPASMEARAFESYVNVLIRHESAWAYWLSLGENPKDMVHFNEVSNEVGRLGRQVFQAFDGWQGTAKRTIHVPVEDIRQVIYDALMSNAEALPGYGDMTGPTRGHALRAVADKLIELIRAERVQVMEVEMDALYCDPCTEQLAA